MAIFQTDWAAMTLNDWAGLLITLGVFFLMIWAYAFTFNPKNKESFEAQRHSIFDDEIDNETDADVDSSPSNTTLTQGNSKNE